MRVGIREEGTFVESLTGEKRVSHVGITGKSNPDRTACAKALKGHLACSRKCKEASLAGIDRTRGKWEEMESGTTWDQVVLGLSGH